jgi:hypothetical protein
MDKDWFAKVLFDRFFSTRGFLSFGIAFSGLYLSITTYYVYTGFYSFGFYFERLSSAFGVFFMGGIAFQGIILLYVLTKVAKDVELNVSALIEGLRPITNLGLIGSVGWLISLTLIALPFLTLGFSEFGAPWYIGFYGTMYLSGLVIFFALSWGFHQAMVSSKQMRVINLGKALNKHYPQYESEILSTGSSRDEIESLISVYSSIANGKEWPFEWQNVLDVLAFNLLPIALSILGLGT